MLAKDMLQERAGLVTQARAILDTAEKEKRDCTAEERENFDNLMQRADQLKADADRATRLETVESSMEELRTLEPPAGDEPGQGTQQPQGQGTLPQGDGRTQPQVVELRSSVAGDARSVVLQGPTGQPDYEASFRSYLLTAQVRALQQDSDEAGGYTVPQRFMAELIRALDNLLFMRRIARVLPPLTRADSLGVPSLDNDPADADWTVELGTGGEDSTMSFGKREMKLYPLGKRLKVSKTLVRNSAINIDALVRDRLAYKFAVPEENAYLNGTGAMQPLGVFTASNDGISTSRDVSTGNTTTEIRFDGLIEALYSLPAQYRRNLNWIFHRDGVKQIRKLKDGDGRYIWQPSVTAGEPDRILNWPVYESEYAPNTFTAGLYVGVLGNFQYYWIADALSMSIQVLMELYAEANQVGYIGRKETDGMPVLEAAFARVKLST